MGHQATTTLPQKVHYQRWMEDKCFQAGLNSLHQLSKVSGVSTTKITRSFSDPEDLWPRELLGLAKALKIHWFHDMMKPMNFGTRRINYAMLDQLASAEGFEISLLVNQAA